jgi:hypothetical protein
LKVSRPAPPVIESFPAPPNASSGRVMFLLAAAPGRLQANGVGPAAAEDLDQGDLGRGHPLDAPAPERDSEPVDRNLAVDLADQDGVVAGPAADGQDAVADPGGRGHGAVFERHQGQSAGGGELSHGDPRSG